MKKSRKLFWITVIVLLQAVSLIGCWNRQELSSLGLVMALAIDQAPEKNKVSITVQLANPREVKQPSKTGGGGTKPVWVATNTGYSFSDALRNFVSISGRKLFYAHNQVIVIGEEAARKGVRPFMDFLSRNYQIRRTSWVVVAKGVKGARILQFQSEMEKVPAMEISSLIKAKVDASTAAGIDIHDFIEKLTGDGIEPIAGGIELTNRTQPEGGEAGKDKNEVSLTGTAVFKEDKLVGWLNKPETRGLLWILGQVNRGIIVVESPKDIKKPVALEITRASGAVAPEFRNGKLVIKIKIKEEGNLGENMSEVDVTRPGVIKTLEDEQKKVIENEIRAALKKAQKEFKTDIFGFGASVSRNYPNEWNKIKSRWSGMYPDLAVELDVATKIRQQGMVSSW